MESGFNVVSVDTGGAAPVPAPRLSVSTSACGMCGSTAIEEMQARITPLPVGAPWSVELLADVPGRVHPDQDLFAATGAVHAAAAFDRSGTPLVVREDIGRHNAVDKVVGRLLLDGQLPAHDLGLYISGRPGFEIVQKAWAAGFSALVGVSAPSALGGGSGPPRRVDPRRVRPRRAAGGQPLQPRGARSVRAPVPSAHA